MRCHHSQPWGDPADPWHPEADTSMTAALPGRRDEPGLSTALASSSIPVMVANLLPKPNMGLVPCHKGYTSVRAYHLCQLKLLQRSSMGPLWIWRSFCPRSGLIHMRTHRQYQKSRHVRFVQCSIFLQSWLHCFGLYVSVLAPYTQTTSWS